MFYPEDFSVDETFFEAPASEYDRIVPDLIVEPRAGRVAIFSSGAENPHRVEPVISGERYVLSFWFTCDKRKEFEIFLDGKAHVAFSHKIRDAISQRSGSRPRSSNHAKSDL